MRADAPLSVCAWALWGPFACDQQYESSATTAGLRCDDAKLAVLSHHYGTGADDLHLKGKMQVAWMDVCEDLGETDGSFMPASMAPPLSLTKVAMSAQAMALDAADGVIDGQVGEFKHTSLMGDKRWA